MKVLCFCIPEYDLFVHVSRWLCNAIDNLYGDGLYPDSSRPKPFSQLKGEYLLHTRDIYFSIEMIV